MALKKSKVVKYTTSDGTEFIGGNSKTEALEYENDFKKAKVLEKIDRDILTILSQTVPSFQIPSDIEEGDIYNCEYPEDFHDLMNQLFEHSECPGDIEDFKEMVSILYNIINSFGGLNTIERLYKYAEKFINK